MMTLGSAARRGLAAAGRAGLSTARLVAGPATALAPFHLAFPVNDLDKARAELAAELDRFMAARGYDNRSEAIRDLARGGLQQAAISVDGERPCVAALVYVYDHEARELPKRLTRTFHDHHDLAQTTLHMHLDHANCLEVTVLKGRGKDVQTFADGIIAERGVRHGQVVVVPSEIDMHRHGHSHPVKDPRRR